MVEKNRRGLTFARAIETIREEHHLKGFDRCFSVYCEGIWELREIAKGIIEEESKSQEQIRSGFEVAELVTGKLVEIMRVRRFVMTCSAGDSLSPEQESLLERSRLPEGREEAFLEAVTRLDKVFGTNLPMVAAIWAENNMSASR